MYINQNLVTEYPTVLSVPADTMRPETWGGVTKSVEVENELVLLADRVGWPLRVRAQLRSIRGGGGFSTPIVCIAGPLGRLDGEAIVQWAIAHLSLRDEGWQTIARDDSGAGWEAHIYS